MWVFNKYLFDLVKFLICFIFIKRVWVEILLSDFREKQLQQGMWFENDNVLVYGGIQLKKKYYLF